jgi:hypothetical protein
LEHLSILSFYPLMFLQSLYARMAIVGMAYDIISNNPALMLPTYFIGNGQGLFDWTLNIVKGIIHMANRKGLGESKKYSTGSIHENASGQFMIKDRYMDDNDVITLEIEWLSGDKTGEIESNKEVNISASIHKFQVSRSGRYPHLPSMNPQTKEEKIAVVTTIEEIHAMLVANSSNLTINKDRIEEIHGEQNYNKELLEAGIRKMDSLHETIQQQQQTISQLSDQIKRMIDHEALLKGSQEAFMRQQETLNKLVEKI